MSHVDSLAREVVKSLVTWRKSQGLLQKDVAERLHTTRPAVSVFESCQHDPLLGSLARYAEAVGLELKVLLVPAGSSTVVGSRQEREEAVRRYLGDLEGVEEVLSVSSVVQSLVAKRRESGLSANKLASVMGVPRSSVRQFEAAAGDSCLSTVLRYASALGCRLVFVQRSSESELEFLVQDLAAARRVLGLTQAQVAKAMGTTQAQVSLFETGKSDPFMSTILRYARAVGVDLSLEVE